MSLLLSPFLPLTAADNVFPGYGHIRLPDLHLPKDSRLQIARLLGIIADHFTDQFFNHHIFHFLLHMTALFQPSDQAVAFKEENRRLLYIDDMIVQQE